MFEKISQSLKGEYQQETRAERGPRMLAAAASGWLVATVYVLTFFLVNAYTFPGLPLGIDWARLLGMWIALSAAFAFFGAAASWFTEDHIGIIGGGIIFTALAVIVFLFSSRSQDNGSPALAILTALPLLGVSMLGAWALRWAARRYLEIRDEKTELRRGRLTKHVLTIMLVGLIPGILMRMDTPSTQAIGQLHELLQAAPTDPSVWPRLPLKKVPALQDHFGVDYLMYVQPSSRTAGALDVTVKFSDGYAMTCLLTVGTGESFITNCTEGDEVKVQ